MNDKKYFNTVENFQGKLFFRASANCSKILSDKKYIFNAVNPGKTLFFRASASFSKILNGKNIFNTVVNFTANSVFQCKVKKIQYTHRRIQDFFRGGSRTSSSGCVLTA